MKKMSDAKSNPVIRRITRKIERLNGRHGLAIAKVLVTRGHGPIDVSSRGPFVSILGTGGSLYTTTALRNLLEKAELLTFEYLTTYERWIGHATPMLEAAVKSYQGKIASNELVSIRIDALEELVRSVIMANNPPVTTEKVEEAKLKLLKTES